MDKVYIASSPLVPQQHRLPYEYRQNKSKMIRIPTILLLIPLLLLQLHDQGVLVNSFVVPHHVLQQYQTYASRQQQERRVVNPLFLLSDSLENKDGSEKDTVWVRKSGSTTRENNNDTSSVQQFNGYSVFPEDQDFSYSAFLDRSAPKWMTKVKEAIQWTSRALTTATNNVNKNEDFGIAEEDDSYSDDIRRRKTRGKRALLKRALQLPWKGAKSILSLQYVPEPGTLILVRHGESQWNKNKTFTGWADPDLTEQGAREVEHAARLLMEGGYRIDVVFTSRLKRAIRSVWILLQELNAVYMPVFKSWRLNERMYGALTGLSKQETAEQLGQELVQEWRGSLRSRPPPVTVRHPYWPGRERKYADLSMDQIPMTESLIDCMERTFPLWERRIMVELKKGRNVMVVAHANTLRGLVKTIDSIGDDEIQEVAIPTGIPIVYKFDKQMKPIPPTQEERTVSQIHMNGLFLEKPGLLKEAFKREESWAKAVPGYDDTMARHKTPMSSLERSLYKLNAIRELGEWASEFIDPNAVVEDDGNDGNMGRPIQYVEDKVWEMGMKELESGGQFDPDAPVFHEAALVNDTDGATSSSAFVPSPSTNAAPTNEAKIVDTTTESGTTVTTETQAVPTFYSQPCVQPMPSESFVQSLGDVPIRRDSVIVIIRHGKTQHNKLGLFTGWEDAPLADEGTLEARQAGRLLKQHGFEFDVVYTSWLSRALETAWCVMDEMDCLWLPIVKTWRLNERMYGELTGLSKQMVKQRHGEAQFKAWRRGFNVRPPAVSSFSQHYPGNDERYQKYLRDVRYSVRESIIRSIERGSPTLQRKLPKSESLKDCMDRTIPYFKERIFQDAVNQGKRVLISSSENAIRGLLMHLCEIPEEEITGLEIPNGLPLIFDVKSKCVKLLDDGSGRDPLEVYNFGKAAAYLFRPCQNEDGSPDEECYIHFDSGRVPLTKEEQETIDLIKRGSPTRAPVEV